MKTLLARTTSVQYIFVLRFSSKWFIFTLWYEILARNVCTKFGCSSLVVCGIWTVNLLGRGHAHFLKFYPSFVWSSDPQLKHFLIFRLTLNVWYTSSRYLNIKFLLKLARTEELTGRYSGFNLPSHRDQFDIHLRCITLYLYWLVLGITRNYFIKYIEVSAIQWPI